LLAKKLRNPARFRRASRIQGPPCHTHRQAHPHPQPSTPPARIAWQDAIAIWLAESLADDGNGHADEDGDGDGVGDGNPSIK